MRSHLVALLASLSLGVTILTGCGVPPELLDPPGTPVPRPSATGGTPGGPAPSPVLPSATTPGFSGEIAVDCAGEPEGDEILDLLREEGVLDADAEATIEDGPLCSGTWQLTVVAVPDLDPLQVMTRGDESLELVTAGTDVCTVEVRVQAPPGMQAAAGCT